MRPPVAATEHSIDADSVISGEWRLLGGRASLEPLPKVPGPAHRPSPRRLFLRASRRDHQEERDRAVAVVAEAKHAIGAALEDVREGRTIDMAPLEPVVAAIIASVSRDETALPSVTRLKERHEYTYLHSVSVCGLMVSLARRLNLDHDSLRDIGLAGLMHDIGKARVPRLLLDKPSPLTPAEFAIVQEHTERGHELLAKVPGIPAIALDVCLHHHERIDGTGYPSRLGGDALSIHARMGAICDVYDAVTSERAYKRAWAPAAAYEWMLGTDGHFDRAVLKAFGAVLGPFPIGTLVRLESGMLAVVIDDPHAQPLSPTVCAFHCLSRRRDVDEAIIPTGDDRIVSVERPGAEIEESWPALRAELLARHRRARP